MKKGLILLIISVLFITGCSNDAKKENTKVDNKSNKVTQKVEKTKENTESKEEISEIKEEVTNEETTKEENPIINQQVNNNPSETTENIQTEQPVQAPACTPKKFDNTYSYVYNTQDECKTGGNLAFMDITEDGTSDIFAYGCREIVDECGTTYYGVIFYNAPDSIVYR